MMHIADDASADIRASAMLLSWNIKCSTWF